MWHRAPPLRSMKCQTYSLQPCSITHELRSGLKKYEVDVKNMKISTLTACVSD